MSKSLKVLSAQKVCFLIFSRMAWLLTIQIVGVMAKAVSQARDGGYSCATPAISAGEFQKNSTNPKFYVLLCNFERVSKKSR